jgi:predicted O-linked N-acetylglucosamine transferase (SPINDLY family)
VGASVLSAAGLSELICEDLDSYFECALRLARSPLALEELRERIQRSKDTAPLFDTAQYVRDFESALIGLRRHS